MEPDRSDFSSRPPSQVLIGCLAWHRWFARQIRRIGSAHVVHKDWPAAVAKFGPRESGLHLQSLGKKPSRSATSRSAGRPLCSAHLTRTQWANHRHAYSRTRCQPRDGPLFEQDCQQPIFQSQEVLREVRIAESRSSSTLGSLDGVISCSSFAHSAASQKHPSHSVAPQVAR